MTLASIIIGAREWLIPATLLGALAFFAMLYAYWRGPARPNIRFLAVALKTVAIAILVLCLLEPLLNDKRPRAGANLFIMLMDNSQSMQIQSRGGEPSRGEQVKSLLAADSDWQSRLGRDFDVRWYGFDQRVRSVAGAADLSLDGNSSSLATSLLMIADRFRNRDVAGILLPTDGLATDKLEDAASTERLPPVFPIVAGESESPRDIRIKDVSVSQTSFEEAPVTVNAIVESDGYEGETLVADLLTDKGELVEQQRAQAAEESTATSFRFQFRPLSSGVSFYELCVRANSEEGVFDNPEQTGEATLANNRRLVMVNRGQGPYRVLYVSGRPNWEFKFLRRAIEDDPEVGLVGLLRIARREPKFDFRGRSDETTNPLFRGFGNQQDEQAEQYDEPVLLRLGTRDEMELRGGFPRAAEELFEYHAVILDDVEAAFFTRDQLSLLQQFVSQRGGGFLMLGGLESLAQGKYYQTAVGEMLPVYLDRTDVAESDERYRLVITRDGWLQPWVRLRSTEAAERQRLDAMPAFHTVNRLGAIKPGATVLSQVRDSAGGKYPALVAQRFGKGRSVALTICDLWRWGLKREANQPRELEKAWRQTVRWLVADVPQRVEVDVVQAEDDADQPVQLRVAVYDPKFEPLDNARVDVRVRGPDGKTTELIAESSHREAGIYETAVASSLSGAYVAEIKATADDGSEIGVRQTGWTAEPAREEFRTLRPNRELLELLAQSTGGEVIDSRKLDRFVASLPSRASVITEPWIHPFWHQWWIFALAAVCLVSEWGLRRWKGLP